MCAPEFPQPRFFFSLEARFEYTCTASSCHPWPRMWNWHVDSREHPAVLLPSTKKLESSSDQSVLHWETICGVQSMTSEDCTIYADNKNTCLKLEPRNTYRITLHRVCKVCSRVWRPFRHMQSKGLFLFIYSYPFSYWVIFYTKSRHINTMPHLLVPRPGQLKAYVLLPVSVLAVAWVLVLVEALVVCGVPTVLAPVPTFASAPKPPSLLGGVCWVASVLVWTGNPVSINHIKKKNNL